MILPLLPEGDPFLKEIIPEFRFDVEPHEIEANLIDTMEHHQALGLAANQVGLPYRAFALTIHQRPAVCFNPSIEPLGPLTLHEEGCLSFPGLRLRIKRPNAVILQWTDADRNDRKEMLAGYEAYGAGHELDHLNGITFDTRVSRLVLNMAKKKRAKA